MQLKYVTNIDYMYMYPSSPHKIAEIPWKNKIE